MGGFEFLQELIFPDFHFPSAVEFVLNVLFGEVQLTEEEFVIFVHVEHQLALFNKAFMVDNKAFMVEGVWFLIFFINHGIGLEVHSIETAVFDGQNFGEG